LPQRNAGGSRTNRRAFGNRSRHVPLRTLGDLLGGSRAEVQSRYQDKRMQAARQKLVSIIIPALKRPDLTQRCVNSLLRQSLSTAECEIIVVENEAHPKTILPDPLPQNVRRIELAENYGTTGSINRGVADSSSEYILLLNNDVELDPQFLATLISALNGPGNYGFATGKLMNASAPRNRLDGAGDALLLGGGAFRLGNSDLDVDQFDHPRRVLAGCGAATLFRRSAFVEAEGLDEDFFAYLDDIDLALRVQRLGHEGIYVPDAIAYHIGSATLGEPFHPRIVELMTRNQILLFVKDYPGRILFKLLPRILVFQVLWLSTVLRHAKLVPYVKGIVGAVRVFPRMVRKRNRLRHPRVADTEFLQLLQASEKQILDWENTRTPASRSRLLKIYFTLFGEPKPR
jgi:GT2 family glycosyltransferase